MSLELKLGGQTHKHYMDSVRNDLFYFAHTYKNRSLLRAINIYSAELKNWNDEAKIRPIPIWLAESMAITKLENYVRPRYHINRFKTK